MTAPSVEYGEYSAFKVHNGLRYQRSVGGKKGLVKEVTVPEPIRNYFKQALGIPLTNEPTGFDKATAPEQAAQVAPAPTDIPVSFEPEDIQDDMLSDEDFLEAEEMAAQDAANQLMAPEVQQAPPVPTQIEVSSPPVAQVPVAQAPVVPAFPPAPQGKIVPVIPPKFPSGLAVTPQQVIEKANDLGFSIFDASLEDLAKAMHERFGVYTVFNRKYPEADEVNPFTGELMTNYERGQAYQAARRTLEQGRLDNVDYAKVKEGVDQSRQASRDYIASTEHPAHIMTAQEHKAVNSFEYRTSVRGGNENPSGMQSRNNPDGSGEPIPEPPLAGKPLIRPHW